VVDAHAHPVPPECRRGRRPPPISADALPFRVRNGTGTIARQRASGSSRQSRRACLFAADSHSGGGRFCGWARESGPGPGLSGGRPAIPWSPGAVTSRRPYGDAWAVPRLLADFRQRPPPCPLILAHARLRGGPRGWGSRAPQRASGPRAALAARSPCSPYARRFCTGPRPSDGGGGRTLARARGEGTMAFFLPPVVRRRLEGWQSPAAPVPPYLRRPFRRKPRRLRGGCPRALRNGCSRARTTIRSRRRRPSPASCSRW